MKTGIRGLWVGKYLRRAALLVCLAAAGCAPLSAVPAAPAKLEAEANTASEADSLVPKETGADYALLVGNKPKTESQQIERVDLNTGKLAAGEKPIEIGKEAVTAFSPDRSLLAVTSKINGCRGTCLQVFQLASLAQTARIELPEIGGYNEWVSQLVFDQQGKQVAITSYEGGKLWIADFTSDPAGEIRTADLRFQTRRAAFTADGKQLMLVGAALPEKPTAPSGTNPELQALLLDAKTLKENWREDLPGVKDGFYGTGDHAQLEDNYFYTSGMAADVDNQRIYIAHADEERLTTVDFLKQSVKTVDVQEEKTAIEEVIEFVLSIGVKPVAAKAGNNFTRYAVLSDDLQTLYVGGNQMMMAENKKGDMEFNTTPYGLEAWAVESGKKLLSVDTKALEIRRSPNGMILLKGYDPNLPTYHPYTEIFDPASGKITARLEDTSAYTTLKMNGEAVVVSTYFDNYGKTFLSVIDGSNQKQELLATPNQSYAYLPEYR